MTERLYLRRPFELEPDDAYVRYVVGYNATASGLPFRTRPGVKGRGDVVLEWCTPSGWRAVGLPAVGG